MVVETVLGYLFLAVAGIGLITAIYRRSLGTRRFGKWYGGGKVTFTGAVAESVFIGCWGAAFVRRSALWMIPAFCAYLVLYVSENRADRRHEGEEEEFRRMNALGHPEIFDAPPPRNIDATPGEHLDLYDAGACTYIGRICKSDMRATINAFSEMSDESTNDIFVIKESLELIPESEVTQEFTALLHDALKQRDYLLLRWIPECHRSKNLNGQWNG